jgi:hypothetical protein
VLSAGALRGYGAAGVYADGAVLGFEFWILDFGLLGTGNYEFMPGKIGDKACLAIDEDLQD